MGTKKIDASILYTPEIQKAIRGGVIKALVGSGWALTDDLLEEQMAEIVLLLVDGYLDRYDANRGKALKGYCHMVAFKKTCSYVKLHVHKHDGAVNRGTVNHTDFTKGDDTDCDHREDLKGVYADDSASVAFLRIEQRQRLENALEALEADERSHFQALMSGRTSAEWAAENGLSTVQATRQKNAFMAKLAALVQADE